MQFYGQVMPCPYMAVHKQAFPDVSYLVLGMLRTNGDNGFLLGISISKGCKFIIIRCWKTSAIVM